MKTTDAHTDTQPSWSKQRGTSAKELLPCLCCRQEDHDGLSIISKHNDDSARHCDNEELRCASRRRPSHLLRHAGIRSAHYNRISSLRTSLFLLLCLAFLGGLSAVLDSDDARDVPAKLVVSRDTSATTSQQPESSVVHMDYDHAFLRSRLLQTPTVDNTTCNETCCLEFYCTEPPPGEPNPFASVPFGVQILLIIILILLSALFSGLTLGLMGLDKTGLEIVMSGDDEVNARYAKRIYPIRKNGNLLLCTLLLGNVAVNALLSILTAENFGGLVGFLASTFLIVIFGEILPQAVCSRHALRVGSATVPLVRVIMVLFFPIAFPLGWLLDKLLGQELATTYSSAELTKLLQIHVQEAVLDSETAVAMKGALEYKNIAVKDVMTPMENTFMLSVEERLNFETIAKIFKTGYSRIPVYEVDKVSCIWLLEARCLSLQPPIHPALNSFIHFFSPIQNNVIGLLFVKDLIFIDPEDETRVADFVEIFGRALHVVWVDDKLGDVLRELKQGRSHMALVRDVNNEDETQDPFYEVKGIITLEDIIEEILGDEIVDETDAFVDGQHSVKLDRNAETFRWASLRLLDSKIIDQKLTFDEARAVTAHLSKNFPAVVDLLTENQLYKLVSETPVSIFPTAEHKLGEAVPNDLIYKKDTPSDVCTLIMAGKVTVLAGADCFRSDVSSWSVLGAGALKDPNYMPDFNAFVSSGPCRCIRITRSRFAAAVDASTLERHSHQGDNGATSTSNVASRFLPIASSREIDTPDVTAELDESRRSRKTKLFAALQAVRTPAGAGNVKKKAPGISLSRAGSQTGVGADDALSDDKVPTGEAMGPSTEVEDNVTGAEEVTRTAKPSASGQSGGKPE